MDIEKLIIDKEIAALEKWNNGDPDGYLAIYAEDITYFDPFTSQRIDGWDSMKAVYDAIRGQISVDRYELPNPKVVVTNEMAVLTFNLYSYTDGEVDRWNCTEVYRLMDGDWKIIQTHWSNIQPLL